jgi:two-component system sensor histidine kinase KdpD
MRAPGRLQLVRLLAVAVPSLAAATIMVALVESVLGIPNAAFVYLMAVVASAIVSGRLGAVVTAVASFLLYDFFFTEPRFTLTIKQPEEWLSLVLLLFVGIVVGELAAMERSRAEVARAREREARALFRLSRDLATRTSTADVLPVLATTLAAETRMARVWIALGEDEAAERVIADSRDAPRPPTPPFYSQLRQAPGADSPEWLRIHHPPGQPGRGQGETYRVSIPAGASTAGAIWCLRGTPGGPPDQTETRLLAAAADQIGQVIAHDRLADEVQAAEIARQSDALKSALLQSVSHDLRTPLATIRAAAGTLRPGSRLSDQDRLESVAAIDREVDYLNRIVTNLLELSRIEAGTLRAEREVFELEDVVGRTIDRLRQRLGGRPLEVRVSAPPVRVDPVLLDDSLTNILDNAIKYTAPETLIRISATKLSDRAVRLTIEDGGGGVPPKALPRLFEKFYRVPGRDRSSRSGTGIGLAVVRGLIEATGGRVRARRSELGGLAIDLDLPCAEVPAALRAEARL